MNEQAVIETEVKQEEKTISPPRAIAVSLVGQLDPRDHLELKAVIKNIAEGGGFPKRFDTPQKQMAAYSLGRALMKERWQLALNNIAEIQGQMMIYGELPRSLAEQTGQVEEFKVYVINGKYEEICAKNKNLDDTIYSGVAEVKKKGRELHQYFYTIKEAEKAGQYPAYKPEWVNKQRTGNMILNEDSPWMKYTKIMLMRKAQAMAVKFEFPEALAGAPIAEYEVGEAPDLAPSMKDVSVSRNVDKLNLINETFSKSLAPTGGDARS